MAEKKLLSPQEILALGKGPITQEYAQEVVASLKKGTGGKSKSTQSKSKATPIKPTTAKKLGYPNRRIMPLRGNQRIALPGGKTKPLDFPYYTAWAERDPNRTTVVEYDAKELPFFKNNLLTPKTDNIGTFKEPAKKTNPDIDLYNRKIETSLIDHYYDEDGNRKYRLLLPKTSPLALAKFKDVPKPQFKGNDQEGDLKLLADYMDVDTFNELNKEALTTIGKIYDNEYVSPLEISRLKMLTSSNNAKLGAYQEYYNLYGGTDLSEYANFYSGVSEMLPDVEKHYGKFDSKEAFEGSKKDAPELEKLYGMPSKELEGKKGVAYTTWDGYQIKWEDLHQDALVRETINRVEFNYNTETSGAFKKKDVKYETIYVNKGMQAGDQIVYSTYTTVKASDDKAYIYNLINRDPEALEQQNIELANGVTHKDKTELQETTEEEVRVFNTLWEEESPEAALEFLNLISPELRKKRVSSKQEEWSEMAKDSPVGSYLASVMGNVYNNATGWAYGLIDYGDGEIDPYDPIYDSRHFVNTVRDAQEQNIDSGAGKWLYRNGTSIVDNLLNRVASGGNSVVSGILSGSGAAVDTVLDAKTRGLSDEDAITLGVIAGAAEGFFESKAMETIFGGKDITESTWKYIVNSISTEVKGELATQATTDISDYLIAQDASKINLAFQNYKNDGMSDSEAIKSVVFDKLWEYGDVAASAAFSAGIMSGGNAAAGAFGKSSYMASVGEQINNNPDASHKIMTTGVTYGVPEAVDIVNGMKDGKAPTAREMGKATEKVITESITRDGGMINVMNWISTIEGRDSSYVGSMEAIDTSKAVMRFAQGKATDVDKTLISRSDGATTVLTAIENKSEAWKSLQKAAKTELRDVGDSSALAPQNDIDGKYKSDEHAIVRDGDVFTKDGKQVAISDKSDVVNGVVVNGESKRMKETDSKGYGIAEKLATSLKKPVKFVKGLFDADGNMLDGVETDSGIFINTEAKNPIKWAATHEFSHTMKKSAGEAWAKYQNFVVDMMKKDGNYYDVFEAKAKAYGTRDVAYINEEIAADHIGETFDSVDELADFIKKDRGLAVKVRDFYYKALDKLGLVDEKKKAQLMWRDAYREAVLNTEKGKVESSAEKKSASGTRASEVESKNRITAEMSDTERTKILSAKSVVVPVYEGQADATIENNLAKLNSGKITLVKNALVTISEQFGVIGSDVKIEDVDVEITFSKSNIKESVSKEITPTEIAKLMPVLKDAVSNAIGIERHDNRYYYDTSTVFFDNLLGGFVEGEYFVPVRFGLKHSDSGEATLYVVVDQNKIPIKYLEQIKKTEVVNATAPIQKETATSASRSVEFNISQIIPFVKSKDLLRYIPDNMLDAEQKTVKWEAVAETIKTTANKNDKKYKQYISEGKLYEAQKMVEAAARANGYNVKAYHGTGDVFYEFSKNKRGNNTGAPSSKKAFFFVDNENVAKGYAEDARPEKINELYKKAERLENQAFYNGKYAEAEKAWEEYETAELEYKEKGVVMPVYLKIDNPLIYDFEGSEYREVTYNELIQKAIKNGNDGVIFKNTYDGSNKAHDDLCTVYAVFDSEQSKSSDTITYDDDGNIIPLSQRFNKAKGDIRYSISGTRVSEIEAENAKLKGQIENMHIQLNQAEGKGLDIKEIKRVAQDFRKQYGSKVRLSELHQDLSKLYTFMQSDKATADEVSQRISQIADKVINNATHTVKNEEYSELLDRIKDTKIMVPESERADFRDGYETFRKGNMGKITLVNDGTALDVFWDELTEEYPELFDEDILGSEERLDRILEVREEFAPREESVFTSDAEMQEARLKLENDIMETFFEIPEGESNTKYVFYDKRVAGVEKELADTSKKLDLSNKKTTRAGIDSDFNYLSQMVKNPTDNKHVPENMRAGVAALLRCFNYETKYLDKLKDAGKEADSPTAVRIADMYNSYTNIIKASWGIENTEQQFVDQFLTDDLKEMIGEIPVDESGGFKRLEDMSIDELRSMAKVLRSVHHTITQRNKAFNTAIKEEISELGFNAAEDFKNTRAHRKGSGEKLDYNTTVIQKAARVVDKYFNYDNVQPWDFFHEIGGTMERLYMEERKGFDQHILNLKHAADAMQKATEGIDINKVTGKGAPKIRFKTSFDEELVLSKGQILSLYALYNRKQGKEHILGGGIVTGKKYYNADGQKGSANTAHPITETDLGKLFDENISSEEKAMVKAVVEFMSKECAKWGNETSMKLYGYEKFGESWYFPIDVSKQTLNTYYGEKGEGNIRSHGSTKRTAPHAKNAIEIRDFFDVVTGHINWMSLYNTTVFPMLDTERVLNYTESGSNVKVRADLIRTFGKNAEAYIEKFHKDENGSIKTEKSGAEKLANFSKKASIGFNARVLFQQPTSIARAYMFLSPKDIPASFKGAAMIKEMREVCPIAYWKSLGFRDIGTGSSLKTVLLDNESLYSKAEMGLYGKADDFTWGLIYGAVKNETMRKNPELDVKSQEFKEKVRDRFNYIVDRTQVVDSVFHRTQNMRSDNAYTQTATMFMSEALKTYNLYRTELKDSVKDKHKFKTAARATAVFAVSNILLSLAQALPDAWREDDEKELFGEKGNPIDYWDRYWKKFNANMLDNINPLTYFPYIKDVWSIVQGFTSERVEYSRITDLIIGAKNLSNDKQSLPSKVISLASTAASVFGISIGNLKRDIFSLAETVMRETGDEYSDYLIDKFKYNVNNPSNKSKFMKHYERAIANGHAEDAAIILEDYMAETYDGKDFNHEHAETVIKEMSSLYGKTDDDNKLLYSLPSQKFSFDGKELVIPDEDYPEYVSDSHDILFDLAYEMINDERYKGLSNEDKVRSFGEIKTYSQQAARMEIVDGYELDGWRRDVYNGETTYMDSVLERAADRQYDKKRDAYKDEFEFDSSKFSDAGVGVMESVEADWAGYHASKDMGREIDEGDYRHIIVYEERLADEMPVEEYAGVRAYAKTEAIKSDEGGSDESLSKSELWNYLETTDYGNNVKGALFDAIGNSNWINPYTGMKVNGEAPKGSGGSSGSSGKSSGSKSSSGKSSSSKSSSGGSSSKSSGSTTRKKTTTRGTSGTRGTGGTKGTSGTRGSR